jgi:pyocin large subunit-like protein
VAVSEASATSGTLTEVSKKIGAPSRPIWSKTDKFTSVGNALKHSKDHRKEFIGIQNSKQYVEHAWKFRDRTDVMIKVRTNGERVLYDPSSNTFGVFTRAGTPKTVFKPRDGMKYFNDDKGIPYGNR